MMDGIPRFAAACGMLFGEDLMRNEDYLYEKARLKIAAEEIRKLVNGTLYYN